jgi:hypothetical protein
MPPARLSDVMLLPRRSNWQARVHDKFEESTSGFGEDGECADSGSDPPQAGLRLTPGAADEGGAYKLSNGRIAQFLCSSFVPPTLAHVGSRIHLFRRCSLTFGKGRRDGRTELRRRVIAVR